MYLKEYLSAYAYSNRDEYYEIIEINQMAVAIEFYLFVGIILLFTIYTFRMICLLRSIEGVH